MGQGQNEKEAKMSAALEKVANAHGLESPTAVALAYVMAKAPNVFPIVVSHCWEITAALPAQLLIQFVS